MKKWLLPSILIIGLLFRICLVPVARHGDINNNTSWGRALLNRGSTNFYDGTEWEYSFPNQPPLYIYIFAFVSLVDSSVKSLIHSLNDLVPVFPSSLVWWWDQWGELYTAKIPGILADLGIAILIYKFAKKENRLPVLLTFIWIINPISWYNSAIWGGTDSIVNLFGILSLYYLITKKNLTKGLAIFLLSLLFKGSLTLLTPFIFLLILKLKPRLREVLKTFIICFVILTIIWLPFHQNINLYWYIFNLYTTRFFPGEIGSLTANAFNFWWLIDPSSTLDSTVYFGFQARIWGYLLFIPTAAIIFYKFYRAQSVPKLLFLLCMIPLSSFLFLTRIHERYMYPFFPLATIGLISLPWIIAPYIILSAINLLNMYHLFWAPGVSSFKNWYTNPSFMTLLSAISVSVFGYLLFRLRKSI